MEKELNDLKTALRSIVVSSPAQMDVRSLQRDYKNLMGVPIPIAKYGHRDVLAFLRERCSDCFLFQGLSSNPVLTLIVPESLKHIDQFVQKQKPSSITKMKGKRRSVQGTLSRPAERPNLICETFKPHYVSVQHLNKNQTEVKTPDNNYKQVDRSSNKPAENVHNSTKELTDYTKSTPSIKSENGVSVKVASSVEQNGYHGSSVRNFLKKRLPMYDSSQYLDKEECSEEPEKTSSKGDNDSGRQTSSSQSSTKKAQLEELKCEILELIKENEDGILCTDLMRLYRERYSRELNLARFAHNNINGALAALGDRVWLGRTPSGPRVRAAPPAPRAAPPAPRAAPPAPPAPAARPLPRPVSLRALPVDPDDALPGIDFEPDVFPADCVHFLESIPPARLRELRPGAMLEVAVGEVYSPSHFWLQRLGPAHSRALDDLMDDMAAYYGGEGRERTLARGAVCAGHYCSSLYERDWHRSLIVKVLDADTVKVRHVDYGTVDAVPVAALKPLLRRWAQLPAQAVRARLAALRPSAGGRRWPHAAAAHFLHLVRDRRFVANIVAVDPEEDAVETFLIDTSGADDVCVSSEMIRAGHADARGDSALRTGECYLYPRFEALESGATPNFGEIHRYLADGINLEYVDAYRRYVPSALPAPPAPFTPPARRELLTRPSPLPAPESTPTPTPPASTLPAPAPSDSALATPVSTASIPSASMTSVAVSSDPVTSTTVLSALVTSPAFCSAPVTSTTVPSTPVTSPAFCSAPVTSPAFLSAPVTTTAVSSAPVTSPAFCFAPVTSTAFPSASVTTPAFCSAPVTSTAVPSTPVTSPAFCTFPVTSTAVPTLAFCSAPVTSPAFRVPMSTSMSTTAVSSGAAASRRARGPLLPTPPRSWAPPAAEVRLSLQECDLYSMLRSLDPEAAHCYMASALRRAAVAARGLDPRAPPAPNPHVPNPPALYPYAPPALNPHAPRALNPHAPEFRAWQSHLPAPLYGPPPPAYPRAPPGF